MSRRHQITMRQDEIRDFLDKGRTMILVSNGKDGFPHPMPMWFWVDDLGVVYMTTFRKSQKINNIKRDPRVSLLLESGDAYQELKSVLIFSNAEVIDDIDYTAEILFNLSSARGDLKIGEAEENTAIKAALRKTAEKRVVIKLVPDKIISWDHSKLRGKY
ncbi:MAG: pyridoxamine 5'-phosphate oxidase family protein [Pseudomonadales bacterium]